MLAQAFVDFNTIAIAGTVASGTGALTMWLNSQFKNTQKQFYSQIKEVYDRIERFQDTFEGKLDYHEKHDDDRFQSLSNDIWTLKVRNAAVDSKKLAEKTETR